MPREPQTFGVQAARFSLYVPLALAVINLLTLGNRKERGVALAVGAIDAALVLAALILAVAALISMRRYGRKGIYGRAVAGLVLNGLIIASSIFVLVPVMLTARMQKQLIGHWQMHTASAGQPVQHDLVLNGDGTYRLTRSGAVGAVALDGRWVLTPQHAVGVAIDHVSTGDPAAVGKQFGLGTVKTLSGEQLVLATSNGEETYQRVP